LVFAFLAANRAIILHQSASAVKPRRALTFRSINVPQGHVEVFAATIATRLPEHQILPFRGAVLKRETNDLAGDGSGPANCPSLGLYEAGPPIWRGIAK
jgi:hypothetical protein